MKKEKQPAAGEVQQQAEQVGEQAAEASQGEAANQLDDSPLPEDTRLPLEVAEETMLGDLLGGCIDELKVMPEVWQKLSERKQGEVIDRLTRRIEHAIKQAIHTLGSQNYPTIECTLEGVTLKDKNKASLLVPSSPMLHELCDRRMSSVLIVLPPKPDQFRGGTDKVKPDKDQPEIPLNSVQ
jgi:hypothetical protein